MNTADVIVKHEGQRRHLHTMTAGAVLPLVQSVMTGLIFGLAAGVLAQYFELPRATGAGLVVGVLALVVMWLRVTRHWFSLTGIEIATGRDLNGDGYIGDPSQDDDQEMRTPFDPPEVKVRLTQEDDGVYRQEVFYLSADPGMMGALADGLLTHGFPFSERVWTGKGQPFSVNQFRTLRGELIERGLLAMRNPKDERQGYDLTLAGRAVLRHYLTSPSSPSPVEVMQ